MVVLQDVEIANDNLFDLLADGGGPRHLQFDNCGKGRGGRKGELSREKCECKTRTIAYLRQTKKKKVRVRLVNQKKNTRGIGTQYQRSK
jgi:hypothetical protein